MPFFQLPTPPTEYRIVEVRHRSVFAGKLGRRVSDDLVLAQGERRVIVHVAGRYHTLFARAGEGFQKGETVTIRGVAVAPGATIARSSIVKVSPRS